MQTVSFAGSSCTPLLKTRLPSPANHKPNLRPSSAVADTFAALIHGLPRPRILISSRSYCRISDPAPRDLDRTESVVVRASVADVSGDGEATAKSGVLLQTLQLGSLFGLWYLFNIYFNIYNKQVLKVFPYPITITTLQFAVGTVFTLLLWVTSIYKLPKISSAQVPIVGGVALASMTETFFNWGYKRVEMGTLCGSETVDGWSAGIVGGGLSGRISQRTKGGCDVALELLAERSFSGLLWRRSNWAP